MNVIDLTDPPPAAKRPRRAEPVVETIVLDDGDQNGGPTGGKGAAVSEAGTAKPPADPKWLKHRGVKRAMGEFRDLLTLVQKGTVPFSDLELVGDDAMKWRFKVRQFDNALLGGRAMNQDLAELKRRYGQDYVLMEMAFPNDYPNRPFSLRVVSPRMMWYSGHVTAGGSVCMEMLTTSGTDRSWQASFTVEGVLLVALSNMIDCESVVVRTATGPGGRSGPLRIDLDGRYFHNPMIEYSEMEAKAAFQRMLQHHAANGW